MRTISRHLISSIFALLFFACHQAGNLPEQPTDELHHEPAADSLYALGDKFYHLGQYLEAKDAYQKSRILFSGVGDSLNLSTAINDIGLCFRFMGEYDSAVQYFTQSLAIELSLADSSVIIGRYRNIGDTEIERGNYGKALACYQRSLKIATALSDHKSINSLHNSLGNLYQYQERHALALQHFRGAFAGYKALNNPVRMGYAFNNMGMAFDGLNQPDSALHYYRLAKENKQQFDPNALHTTIHNTGEVYVRMGQYDSALHYLTSAYRLRKASGDQMRLAFTANELAGLYLNLQKPDSALLFLNQALNYTQKHSNRSILLKNTRLRADYHLMAGKPQAAYLLLDQWAAMRDSVFNQEKIKTLEMQAAYEIEQKEKETALAATRASMAISQQEIMERNSQITLIVIFILCIFFITSLVFLVVIYSQGKMLHRLNSELTQKNEISMVLNRQNFHFTKNSLAGIVSLLNVELLRLKNEDVKTFLLAGKLRMETVNMLYNRLFASGSPAGNSSFVSLRPFLEETIANTIEALLADSEKIEIAFEMEEAALPQEKMLTLGLIVNEICINACKYAFKELEKGKLFVVLKNKQRSLDFSIADSGQGFPDGFDWKTSDSFGVQLIRILSDDLGAELLIESKKSGVSYTFKLPYE